MKRIVLTDGSGRWLDIEGAERYEEAVRFNGFDFVSLATNRMYFHEELYRLSNGVWLKHWWEELREEYEQLRLF